MRLIAGAMMLLVAAGCLAGEPAYDLSLEFSIDGEHIASPHVVVENGVKSTINLGGRFIDVKVGANPKGVLMEFWIGVLDGSVRKLVATPSAVTRLGRPTELKVILDEQASGMKHLKLVATAQEHSQ